MELLKKQIQLKIAGEKYATEKSENCQHSLEAWPLESTVNTNIISKKDWSELIFCYSYLDEVNNTFLLNSGEHCKPEMQQNRMFTIQRTDNAIACIDDTLAFTEHWIW